MTPEDARFAYMELWGDFLSILRNTVIIVENFELLDDTSIQTLEVYFDKFKNIIPRFIFITKNNLSVHSKIKGLLRTPIYTEFSLQNHRPRGGRRSAHFPRWGECGWGLRSSRRATRA